MTVYDNMAFGLKLRKYSKEDIDKRVQETAEILGLKEFLDRKPAVPFWWSTSTIWLWDDAIVRDTKSILDGRTFVKLGCKKLRVSHAC